jgi:hypothetical protein
LGDRSMFPYPGDLGRRGGHWLQCGLCSHTVWVSRDVREVGGGTAHGQLCPMGGLGVVLEEPGRQSGLREELKEPLGASRKPL